MARKPQEKPPKKAVVAFKVEEELAKLLDKLPNKSAFIRRAIEAQLGRPCPLCQGKGVVGRGVYDHFAPLLEKLRHRSCEGCGDDVDFPNDPAQLEPIARERLEQFFHGGPLYCGGCYDKAPSCGSCDWHLTPERVADHMRQAHAD